MLNTLIRLPKRYYFIIGIALIVAFINAQLRLDSLLQATIPWGIIAFVIAFFASSKHDSLKLSGTFGFIVSYAFLWFDNRGIKSLIQVLVLIPLVIVPSLFGLLCGAVLGYLGWYFRHRFIKVK